MFSMDGGIWPRIPVKDLTHEYLEDECLASPAFFLFANPLLLFFTEEAGNGVKAIEGSLDKIEAELMARTVPPICHSLQRTSKLME